MLLKYEEWSDEKLMGAFQCGDDLAFNTLYGRHKRRVQAIVVQKVSNYSMANDIRQDIFDRVIRSKNQFDLKRGFAQWFNQIANNAINDHFRKMRTSPVDLPEDRERVIEKHMNRKYSEELSGREEFLEKYDKTNPNEKGSAFSLKSLPGVDFGILTDIQKKAIQLRFVKDLEFDEIGRELNMTSTNARKTVSRAVQALRKGRA